MLLTVPDIMILLLIFQLLFSSIYLFSKKTDKAVSNNILGLFFLTICLAMVDNLCLRTGVWYHFPKGATFSSAFPFLYGPLLFLYTQSLIYKTFKFTKSKLLHLIPFTVLFLYLGINYEIQTTPFQLSLLHAINNHKISPYLYLSALVMVLHFAVYATAALLLIKKYKKASLNKFSSVQQINLGWLSSTIIFFMALFVLSLINTFLEMSALSKFYPLSLLIIIVLLFYFINKVIFKALHNPDYFSWMQEDQPADKVKTGDFNTLPDRTEALDALADFMRVNKPYLNPDLTVDTLAKGLRMQAKDLSRLINDNLQQNFFDFVNRYRIQEAQSLLTDNADKKITVLEILYQSGFNSKSSFNTLFKKYTGITPTDFKNQQP